MILHWPQLIYLALVVLSLGVTLAKHGKPREPHNFWLSVPVAAFVLWMLYEGGFFRVAQ